MEVIFTKEADKDISKLNEKVRIFIRNSIKNKLLVKPECYLKPLSWNLKWLYKFRVWDYRLICDRKDDRLIILIIRIKHRKDVYR